MRHRLTCMGWTDGRTDGHVKTKISRILSYSWCSLATNPRANAIGLPQTFPRERDLSGG